MKLELYGISCSEKYLHKWKYNSIDINQVDIKLSGSKTYVLFSDNGEKAEVISRIIGGGISPEKGNILYNEKTINILERKKLFWIVRSSKIKSYLGIVRPLTIRDQIRMGIKNHNGSKEEEEQIKNLYSLSEDRYTRNYRYLSYEGWRASCAIAYSDNRIIICFPKMGFYTDTVPYEVEKWIAPLREKGAMIIIPMEKKNIGLYKYDDCIEIL